MPQHLLADFATARSGDKGNHANIAVVAKDEVAYDVLLQGLTADVVHAWCRDRGCTRVERFELPLLHSFNFMLYDVLAGGASRSLRIDTQGKLLGTAILSLKFEAPT